LVTTDEKQVLRDIYIYSTLALASRVASASAAIARCSCTGNLTSLLYTTQPFHYIINNELMFRHDFIVQSITQSLGMCLTCESKTVKTELLNEYRYYFNFSLPSELLEKQREKFLKKYEDIGHLIRYFGSCCLSM